MQSFSATSAATKMKILKWSARASKIRGWIMQKPRRIWKAPIIFSHKNPHAKKALSQVFRESWAWISPKVGRLQMRVRSRREAKEWAAGADEAELSGCDGRGSGDFYPVIKGFSYTKGCVHNKPNFSTCNGSKKWRGRIESTPSSSCSGRWYQPTLSGEQWRLQPSESGTFHRQKNQRKITDCFNFSAWVNFSRTSVEPTRTKS